MVSIAARHVLRAVKVKRHRFKARGMFRGQNSALPDNKVSIGSVAGESGNQGWDNLATIARNRFTCLEDKTENKQLSGQSHPDNSPDCGQLIIFEEVFFHCVQTKQVNILKFCVGGGTYFQRSVLVESFYKSQEKSCLFSLTL